MIRYLLDTDTLTHLERGHPTLIRRLSLQARHEIANNSISIREQFLGWNKAVLAASDPFQLSIAHERLAARLFPTWCMFVVVPFTEPAILRFERLKAMKLNVGPNDLRIASIALEINATVVTRNLRDFGRVTGLTVEDWTV